MVWYLADSLYYGHSWRRQLAWADCNILEAFPAAGDSFRKTLHGSFVAHFPPSRLSSLVLP